MRPGAGVGLTSVMVALTLTTGMIEAVSFLVLGPVFDAPDDTSDGVRADAPHDARDGAAGSRV